MTAIDPTAGQWRSPRGPAPLEESHVTQPEPSGWELMRSLNQLREDVGGRLGDVKKDINGIGAKIDGLGQGFVTRSEHQTLVEKVETLEARTDKRTDRNVTIWLALGTSAASVITSILLFIFGVLVK